MDIKKIVKIVSWVLSGFTKNFDIFYPDSKEILKSISICAIHYQKNYPEYFGKGSLSGEWFKEIYKAKFCPSGYRRGLLKPLFTPLCGIYRLLCLRNTIKVRQGMEG